MTILDIRHRRVSTVEAFAMTLELFIGGSLRFLRLRILNCLFETTAFKTKDKMVSLRENLLWSLSVLRSK